MTWLKKSCCIFAYSSAGEAGRNFNFETVEEFSAVDYTYSWSDRTQRLVKCKNCGALFLYEKFVFKAMRYEDDDSYYTAFYPVKNRKEALKYSKLDGLALKSGYNGKFIELADGGHWQWNEN